MKRWGQN